jgi:dihydrofolate reductase
VYITTVHVMSLNGRITKDNGDAHSWASDDDWDHFRSLADQHNLFVMDIDTYLAVLPNPEADRLRIVVTDKPKLQPSIPGQLEFVNKKPAGIVKDAKARGYERILLVGQWVNAQFLQAGLVDEMWVTIEPTVFGGGLPLLDVPGLDAKLQIKSVEQLNRRGTLLVSYTVDKPKQAR